MTIASIIRADWGPALHQGARNVAAVLAAVYTAGFIFGAWIHHLNDIIATMLRDAPAPTAPPFVHPLTKLAVELECFTVCELRAMAGMRRKMRKAELVAHLIAA